MSPESHVFCVQQGFFLKPLDFFYVQVFLSEMPCFLMPITVLRSVTPDDLTCVGKTSDVCSDLLNTMEGKSFGASQLS